LKLKYVLHYFFAFLNIENVQKQDICSTLLQYAVVNVHALAPKKEQVAYIIICKNQRQVFSENSFDYFLLSFIACFLRSDGDAFGFALPFDFALRCFVI